MTSLCIIGAGITGLSLLLLLQEAGANLSSITIIDPHFDGGDLARRWGPITSNTPWSKTANALAATCPSFKQKSGHEPTQTTPLIQVANLIQDAAREVLKKVIQINGEALKVEYTDTKSWTVTYRGAGTTATITTKALLFAQGSDAKTLDLPIPSIPLECALDRARLSGYVQPGQRVLVFGTMHSGCLILRNLRDADAHVTAFYRGSTPFVWDRDGAYDGIKEEAAQIADAIVAGTYKKTTLVSTSNTTAVIRAAMQADWAIYAIGFEPRNTILAKVNGEEKSICEYDGKTGQLIQLPNAWGFGIAYPNQAPDGKHWDVSVAAFISHMKEQLPQILAIF